MKLLRYGMSTNGASSGNVKPGMLDDKGVTGHLYKVEGKGSKWTKKLIFDDALKYRSRSEWKQRSPQASRMARQLGIFQLAVEHMERVGSKFKRCIYRCCFQP